MKYICSVYSLDHTSDSLRDIAVREERYRYACQKAGEFMNKGIVVYSPIAHNHPIASMVELPKDWHFWCRMDMPMVILSSGLIVLKMPGWERSTGVQAEITYAESLGLPIEYVECPDYKGE